VASWALDSERNRLPSGALRNAFNTGLELLFPSGRLKVLLNLAGGNEAHGIRKCIRVTSKKAVVKEMWMKHNLILSYLCVW